MSDDIEHLAQPANLVAPERRRRIANLVRDRGSVRARELIDLFGVTDETIRRDLMLLEDLGVLRRAHGGALAPTGAEETFGKRLHENEPEKAAIGAAAAALVRDGSTIILDSGSTALRLAQAVKERTGLVVVTNSVTNAVELMDQPGITVVLTGGTVRPTTFGAVGELAVATIRDLRVDQTFLAIQGVSLEGGLTYPSFEEVAIKRAMIAAGTQVILLADHSKFGNDSLVRVAPIDAVTHIVTSNQTPTSVVRAIRSRGIEVIVATEPASLTGAIAL